MPTATAATAGSSADGRDVHYKWIALSNTRNTSRRATEASAPPSSRPGDEPLTAAMPFMPIALPRSFSGNASARMAVKLANSNAPPVLHGLSLLHIERQRGSDPPPGST
jgi:hypothetical protein